MDVRSPLDIAISLLLIVSAICWAANSQSSAFMITFLVMLGLACLFYGGIYFNRLRERWKVQRAERLAAAAGRDMIRRQRTEQRLEESMRRERAAEVEAAGGSNRSQSRTQHARKVEEGRAGLPSSGGGAGGSNMTAVRYKFAAGAQDKSCTICLSDFDDFDLVNHLFCAHTFHEKCLSEWLSKSTEKACPMCRQWVAAADLDPRQQEQEQREQQRERHRQQRRAHRQPQPLSRSFRGLPPSPRAGGAAAMDVSLDDDQDYRSSGGGGRRRGSTSFSDSPRLPRGQQHMRPVSFHGGSGWGGDGTPI